MNFLCCGADSKGNNANKKKQGGIQELIFNKSIFLNLDEKIKLVYNTSNNQWED